MRAGIGLVLAIGSALVVDPVVRAFRGVGRLAGRTRAAVGAIRLPAVRISIPAIRVPTVRVPDIRVPRIQRPLSSEPFRSRVVSTLGVTLLCVAVGAAITHF